MNRCRSHISPPINFDVSGVRFQHKTDPAWCASGYEGVRLRRVPAKKKSLMSVNPRTTPACSRTQRQRHMQLVLTEQRSLHTEILPDNGLRKAVHYVIKAQPFSIKRRLEDERLRLRLFYDISPPKEVDTINRKPMTYEFKESTEEESTVDVCIHILSTQVQGALFFIEFTYSSPRGILMTRSSLIRVVSKLRVDTKPKPNSNAWVQLAISRLEDTASQIAKDLQNISGYRCREQQTQKKRDIEDQPKVRPNKIKLFAEPQETKRSEGKLLSTFRDFNLLSQGIDRAEQEERLRTLLEEDPTLTPPFHEFAQLFQACSMSLSHFQ
ncbi:hypothetical protein PROFUN_01827 [Planoprotostelium fungivorum]|uniref:Uncharacterized protein n=1 Tax=Planoprotostelium fungivorum TaxID=1890364 RepID=A0A2P6NYR5_9EUKA|nr:hypothetical protein PROFUN_01827 [Planoprotostelium fungivorum]